MFQVALLYQYRYYIRYPLYEAKAVKRGKKMARVYSFDFSRVATFLKMEIWQVVPSESI